MNTQTTIAGVTFKNSRHDSFQGPLDPVWNMKNL